MELLNSYKDVTNWSENVNKRPESIGKLAQLLRTIYKCCSTAAIASLTDTIEYSKKKPKISLIKSAIQ